MTKVLAVAICLLAGPAWAQVEVQVRTEKPQFLAGELAYGGASVKPPPELSVRNGERRVIKGLTGCGSGSGVGGGFGATPQLQVPLVARPRNQIFICRLTNG